MTLEPDYHSLVLRRRIAATPEELFDAWTDAEGMRDRYRGGWGQIVARLDAYLQARSRL